LKFSDVNKSLSAISICLLLALLITGRESMCDKVGGFLPMEKEGFSLCCFVQLLRFASPFLVALLLAKR